jgi:hypothetical protein
LKSPAAEAASPLCSKHEAPKSSVLISRTPRCASPTAKVPRCGLPNPDCLSLRPTPTRVARPGALLYLTTPNYLNATGLYSLYASIRHPSRSNGTDQPLDNHYFFFQVKKFLRLAGWRIVRTDGAVHQFPLLPGHDPVSFEFLESTRFLRRSLRAFALHYFVIAYKPEAPG